MFSGYIFDCDGVLIDSRVASSLYVNRHLELLGEELLPLTEPAYDAIFALPLRAILDALAPGRAAPQLEAVMARVSYDDFLEHLEIEPALEPLLSALRARDLRAGIVTNRGKNFRGIAETLGFARKFDTIVTTEEVAPKPNPAGIERVCRAWRLGPDEVVYIGDSSSDQEAARRAGVCFWAFRNPALAADRHIDGLRELASLVEQGGAPGARLHG